MPRSIYIKAMHPKTEISPTLASVQKILNAGWIAQTKIHGHRAQIHFSADKNEDVIVYNRLGKPHKKLLPKEIEHELRRIFPLEKGWTAVDAEWIKKENKLFIFDVLKLNDKSLRPLSYLERWTLLPRFYISKYIKTLPLLKTSQQCMEILSSEDEKIEGLVFKSQSTKGFTDTAIIRCRKRASKPQ